MPAFQRTHGGPDKFGAALHDFSTNSNACGPCPQALQAVQAADATRYPDASYTALHEQLADFHGVAPARIVLAASASEFIFRITAWAARQGVRQVRLPAFRYGEYALAAQAFGLEAVDGVDGVDGVAGGVAKGSSADGGAVQGSAENGSAAARLAWACEPSSPFGAAHPGLAGLANLADLTQLPAARAIVVLDRAYEPLRLAGAIALDAQALNQVWQLWTPNKALGLTGVRAAYAIAPGQAEEMALQLDAMSPSWPVGAHGVAMLQAWCTGAAQAWLAASLHTLREWKTRQLALCQALGWACLPSDANFFCARPDVPDLGPSLELSLERLRGQGVKLRDTASLGLPGHVRLGVLPPAAQDALHDVWRQQAPHGRKAFSLTD